MAKDSNAHERMAAVVAATDAGLTKLARLNGRVQRLLAARAKCAARLEAHPKDRRAPAWARKLAEFDQSLANFQKFGQETPPTGNRVGVDIDVPKGTFKITEHAPEG